LLIERKEKASEMNASIIDYCMIEFAFLIPYSHSFKKRNWIFYNGMQNEEALIPSIRNKKGNQLFLQGMEIEGN
jgi:hypothetical protein